MTTQYLATAAPVSSLSASVTGRHTRVKIWINGGLAGELVMDANEADDFAYLLMDSGDDREVAALSDLTRWGVRVRYRKDAAERDPFVYRCGDPFQGVRLSELIEGAAMSEPWEDEDPEAKQ